MTNQLTYSFDAPVSPSQVQRLFEQTHWASGRSLDAIETMLHNTPSCLTVWRGETLVGFARLLTDNVYRALLDDVVVETELRGQGVGSEMMRHVVQRYGHVEELLLGCLPEVVPFYERFGFKVQIHALMALKKPKPPAA